MGDIIFTRHLRSVAGVFVLSTGLLVSIGGGAVATADSDSSAPAGTQATDGTTQGTGSTGSTGTTEAQPTPEATPGQGATGGASDTGVPSPGQAGVTSDPTPNPSDTDSDLEKKWTETDNGSNGSGSGTGSGSGSGAGAGVTSTQSTPSPDSNVVVASDSNVPAADSTDAAANSAVATSNSNVVAQETTNVSPLMNVMQPVTNAINSVANVVQSIPSQVAAMQTPVTPMSTVITSVQQMLNTVAGVVSPFIQLSGDLYALLGVPRTGPPLIGGGGESAFTASGVAPLFGQGTAQSPATVPSVTLGAPLFGTMTPPTTPADIEAAAIAQQLSLSGMAQLAPEGIGPTASGSLLQHVVSAVLVPASLSALAALALPGVAGLLVVIAAGMRVGYRQAKAIYAMRAAGIARFAGSGPMGVVRTGALISLHTRTPRTPRVSRTVRAQGAQSAVRQLERVA